MDSKNVIFSNPSTFNFEKIIKSKACKSGKIDAMDLAQSIWFLGCPEKGRCSAKTLKMHFIIIIITMKGPDTVEKPLG